MTLATIAPDTVGDSTWQPPHEDVPTRGLSMSARVESAACPHRALTEELSRLPHNLLLDLSELLGSADDPQRTVRLIAGIVAIRTAMEGRPANASDALAWFAGLGCVGPHPLVERLEALRWSAEPDEHLVSLLPYVLDPFGLTTRRALLAGRAHSRERASRKRLGTFYTPGDVARSLAEEVITAQTRRVLDPACGAGVLLRAAFTRLVAELSPDRAVECLYGVDIDAMAIDACALVLTHDWIMRQALHADELPVQRFDLIRSRLVHANALDRFAEPAQSQLPVGIAAIDSPGLPERFDAVLTNPPFAPMGRSPTHLNDAYESLRSASSPAGTNMMWPFWELVSRVVTHDGRAAIVLPMSAAYLDGDTPTATRRAVFARGNWEMRFFDRSPDALFGDDVKQRIALALRRPGSSLGIVRTSATRRWSAGRRKTALERHRGEGVDVPVEPGLVLKIGSVAEREAVEHLRSLAGTLGDAASGARLVCAAELDRSPQAIAVAPTAYNWIGAFRDTAIASQARRHAGGKLAELLFASRPAADAAYAVVVSHVFLWWWRATGDLFHVTLAALAKAPFPIHRCSAAQLDALAKAGRECWLGASTEPIVAVNKGIATVAYRPSPDSGALEVVDWAMGKAFGLAADFLGFARHDADRLRFAGRTV